MAVKCFCNVNFAHTVMQEQIASAAIRAAGQARFNANQAATPQVGFTEVITRVLLEVIGCMAWDIHEVRQDAQTLYERQRVGFTAIYIYLGTWTFPTCETWFLLFFFSLKELDRIGLIQSEAGELHEAVDVRVKSTCFHIRDMDDFNAMANSYQGA